MKIGALVIAYVGRTWIGVLTIASTGLRVGFRARAVITSDGLVLAGPVRVQTIRSVDIAEVDMVLNRTWGRCRDSEGRVSNLMAASAWYLRTNGRARRDDEELATCCGMRAGRGRLSPSGASF
ncbi:hypothetical protein GCM10010197_01990 [Nocardioides luteus]|uniref:Uncharacterized protein n=1 Tax=Nocardioides luteus TaxID=1844 RepID=A0ABQ5T0I3_9ACTN|nr:hypothetical protein GCM10010197_01990 [Nocardioides luteus]GLJ69423.1 hypothetical protein GCM10017579_34590 [Nocardioides luteus]